MTKRSAPSRPPHEFPAWPFGFTAFYSHAARDFGRCVDALGQATDATQAARAEGDYGVALWRDFMQAYYDLALMPLTAMAKAAARQRQDDAAPGPEPTAAE